MKIILSIIVIIAIQLPISAEDKKLFTIQLKDKANRECWLPLSKKKYSLILYSDYRNLDKHRKFYKRIKSKPELLKKLNMILVINMKPAWYIPNWFMRFRLRNVKKKHNITTCFDESRNLETKWRLRDCDDRSVIILIDRKLNLKYIHYGKGDENLFHKIINETRSELKKVLKKTGDKLKEYGKKSGIDE